MRAALPLLAACALLLGSAIGCKTESYCFANCTGESDGEDGGGVGGQDGGGIFMPPEDGGGGCFGFGCGTGGGGSACEPTNEGVEICDEIDNDCDGEIDEPAGDDDEGTGIDFESPVTCGNCELDCNVDLTRVQQPLCNTNGVTLGEEPGTCEFDACATEWYDADGDPSNGCEYYCRWNPDGTNTSDPGGEAGCGIDDDCDAAIDEDVNVCDDVENCGECGKKCVVSNGTPACVTTAQDGDCTLTNTECKVDTCNAGYHDVDGSAANGCEYECTETNGGVEICDGIDNDCDKLIDNFDPSLEADDPDVGQPCFGGEYGICAAGEHEGVQKCIGGAVRCCDLSSDNEAATNPNLPETGIRNGVCSGDDPPFVITPNEQVEVCDGLDNDCDSETDEDATDAGGVCGTSTGTCETGTFQCVNGGLACIGGVPPTQGDACDGFDNDCDGLIDATRVDAAGSPSNVSCASDGDCAGRSPFLLCRPLGNGNQCVVPPSDVLDPSGATVACDVPATPPSGIPQPCQAGVSSCVGGSVVCVGSIVATQSNDLCGEDTNCDGQLTDQTGLGNDDVENCGECGNDCNDLGQNVEWQCSSGTCARVDCKPGFQECGGAPDDCETACSATTGAELCDGIDNDCNCLIDDNPQPPTVVEACGVSPSATDPGCTTDVTFVCDSTTGGWSCTFPSGYCPGGDCSAATESCDGLDNDCDGQVDENFNVSALPASYVGAPCRSDDGLPPPGHGPCRTTGAYECNNAGTGTICSARKDDSRAMPEVCDTIDNDCDGLVDANDPDIDSDPNVGQTCQGGPQGVCSDPANSGTTACVAGGIACQGANVVLPGQRPETCNNADDDCDGQVDEVADLIDDGKLCGISTGACVPGVEVCVNGALDCQGRVDSQPEVCNNVDDDCDGEIDNGLTDVGNPCDVPIAPPSGATSPCQAGTLACSGGVSSCEGSIKAQVQVDACGEDSNCDGQLSDQPDFDNDVLNCGGCGNDCNAIHAGSRGIWECQGGACVRTACEPGYLDCQPPQTDCETACPFQSGTELCNGLDDDCDCAVDNVPSANTPTPVQVCGVSALASDPNCAAGDGNSGVAVSCLNASWVCDFPDGYCDGGSPASCASTSESCDGDDNNCNGGFDEDFKAPARSNKALNSSCNSEDVYRDLQCATSGDPNCPPQAPPHGVCAGGGTYACSANGQDTLCSASYDAGAAGPELCDGLDNDCDTLVDETFNDKGSNATFFVRPAVVQIGTSPSLWIYRYEASRPGANGLVPGTGNGYWCSGSGCSQGLFTSYGGPSSPAGVQLNRTPACSQAGDIPWFNVTPVEVEQTCHAMGGFICDMSVWQAACEGKATCGWGYSPSGVCSTPADYGNGPFCNLHAFDFDGNAGNGLTDGLLPGGSGLLDECRADWTSTTGNTGDDRWIYDITGNVREITRFNSTVYKLMGGAFNTQSEDGGRCDFDFYSVSGSFKLYDAGFRCCFDSDPRL